MQNDQTAIQPEITQETAQLPPSEHVAPRKPGLTYLFTLILVAFILGGVVEYAREFWSYKTQVAKQNSALKDTKIYVNDFSHVSFRLPNDWITEESTRADGYPTFKLSSPDGNIIINSSSPPNRQEGAKNNMHSKEELGLTTIQFGEYPATRNRFINDFDEIIDAASIYSIADQKPVSLFFTVEGDFDKNNATLLSILKTFTYTQKELSLDTEVSYTLPEGWKKMERNSPNETDSVSLAFVSPDYLANVIGNGWPEKGAMLRVERRIKPPTQSMLEVAEQSIPLKMPEYQPTPTKVGTLDAYALFSCWEGCYQSYFIEQDQYYWQILFTCAVDCTSKAKMDASIYADDRDAFIRSFGLK